MAVSSALPDIGPWSQQRGQCWLVSFLRLFLFSYRLWPEKSLCTFLPLGIRGIVVVIATQVDSARLFFFFLLGNVMLLTDPLLLQKSGTFWYSWWHWLKMALEEFFTWKCFLFLGRNDNTCMCSYRYFLIGLIFLGHLAVLQVSAFFGDLLFLSPRTLLETCPWKQWIWRLFYNGHFWQLPFPKFANFIEVPPSWKSLFIFCGLVGLSCLLFYLGVLYMYEICLTDSGIVVLAAGLLIEL